KARAESRCSRRTGTAAGSASVEVVAQHLRTRRVAQLRHGLGLDLADALSRHAKHAANLVEGLGLAVGQTEAHAHDSRLAVAQGVHDLAELLLEEREAHGVRGNDCFRVLDEVTEL